MRTVLQRIEHALTFCKEYADGSWSIATEKFRHHVTPDLLEDTRQELESLQLKLMHAETKLAEFESREPVAYRFDFDGYGWLYTDNGDGSSWRDNVPNDAEPLYTKGNTNV